MARLSIRLLGGFQVDLKGAPVVDFRSDKVRALLAYLAVESDRPHSRDSLAWLLWPESPNQAARTNLRSALANLRKTINDYDSSPPYLLINRNTIQFNKISDHWLDVSAFVATGAEIGIDTDQLQQFEMAIALYNGPFLSGFSVSDSAPFEEWLVLKREQINRRVMIILSNLATYNEQHGEYEIAETHALKMVELEPWNEEAHRQLMRLLALGGQRSAALIQYEACRRSLAKEFGVEPSRETTVLYEAIQDGELESFLLTPTLQSHRIRITPEEEERSIFVGRQTEIEQLNEALEKALTGKGRVVFVGGSSGIGKTTLINEFVQRSMRTHSELIAAGGKCNAYTGIGDPYLPFVEIMELLTGDIETQLSSGVLSTQHARRLRVLLPATIQSLVEVGPDLIDRMVSGEAMLMSVQTAIQGKSAWLDRLRVLVEKRQADVQDINLQQTDLLEQYVRVLLTLASRHPLILVIDDLQWADMGSINLLFHLGRCLQGSRILVIGAYRSEEVALGRDGLQHPLEQVMLEFKQIYEEVIIDLDQSKGREFIEAFLDSEPNRLGRGFRETLFHQTNGHPLFTIELLRSMQERGDIIKDGDGLWSEGKTLSWDELPVRVEAVIAERIGRLPQKQRRVLEVASVEGEEFTAEVIAEVIHMDAGLLVQQLSEQLGRKHRLVTATQFRRLDDHRISCYQFQHHLFQTYLYESLDCGERAYLHEQVGMTLESFYQQRPGEMNAILVKLARHFREAGVFNKAIDYLCLSGGRAEQLSASEEAINHFRNALAICAMMPETHERDQIELALNMALGAQLVATRGFSSPAEENYSRARQLCQDLSTRLDDTVNTAKQLIPALLGLGAFYGHQARFQEAREIYDQIFELAQAAGDPESMMMAYWGPGYLLLHMGDLLSARIHLENALAAYDPDKHQWLITIFTLDMRVSCLSWLSWTLFFLGYPDQALKRSNEAIALARQISHPFSLAVALSTASGLHAYAFDAHGTRDLAEEAIEICQQKGFTFWLGVASTYRGLALTWLGEHNQGISKMREGEHIWRTSGAIIGLAEHLVFLADALGNAGLPDKGLEVLEEALALIDKSGETIYLAELLRIKGDLLMKLSLDNQDKAEASYRHAIEIARTQHAKILELRAATDLSNSLSRRGKINEARELLQSIYDWFTEGFDARDLRSASTLLQELS